MDQCVIDITGARAATLLQPRRQPRAIAPNYVVALDLTGRAHHFSRSPRRNGSAGPCGESLMAGTDRKRLHVITWGCQMNVYDSGRMADVLAPLGYRPVAEPDSADMVILNTCHIRDKAAEKVFSELGRLRLMKEASGGRANHALPRGVT